MSRVNQEALYHIPTGCAVCSVQRRWFRYGGIPATGLKVPPLAAASFCWARLQRYGGLLLQAGINPSGPGYKPGQVWGPDTHIDILSGSHPPKSQYKYEKPKIKMTNENANIVLCP